MATTSRSVAHAAACGLRDLRVHSSTRNADGEWQTAVAFRLSAGRRRTGKARDWDVEQVAPTEDCAAKGTVFQHVLHGEPLLCLAARGAWSLWNDNVPLVDSDACDGLAIEVTSDSAVVAMIRLRLGPCGSLFSGWCRHDEMTMRLSMATFDPVRRRDVRHWTRLTLSELAFGDLAPPPDSTARRSTRTLPACWSPMAPGGDVGQSVGIQR